MKKLSSVLFASALALAPASAFADVSLADMIQNDEDAFTLNITEDAELNSMIEHGHPGPAPAYHRTTTHTTTVRHYRTNYRPRHVAPVVVVEQPATVVVSESASSASSSSSSSSSYVGSRFGLGLRGVGFIPSDTRLSDGARLSSNIDGGIGFYLKYRPIRWISLEIVNDYLFGHYDVSGSDNDYYRVPLAIGLRGHILDYGNLDVYAAAAFATTFVTLDDGNDYINQELRYVQLGGQFGGGVSFIAGGFEIGLDARYTIDSAPKYAPYGEVDKNAPIHGFLFSINIGFAI